MSTSFRLLIVEDRPEDAELLVAELVRAGFSPQWERVDSADKLLEACEVAPALILCDYALPGLDALQVLDMLRHAGIGSPVIVVSGEMDEETCVKSLRAGAVDYLLKDRLARLGPAVDHALAIRRLALEKREAERKERETATILRGLVAHAPAAISVKAVDGRYLMANLPFELMHGAEPGSLVGRIDAEVMDPSQAREMIELDARCLHNQMVLEREVEVGDGDDVRNMLSVRYPVIDDDGEVSGIGAIYLDVTRQKRVESELRQVRAELMKKNRKLLAGNDELRELDRLKTEFISSVSHELRTPLTSIRGYLEMLREEADIAPEMRTRFMAIIDRNSEHLLSLIEDLLILSRMDSGQYSSLEAELRIADVVGSAVAMLEPARQQAGVDLVVRLPEDLPMVIGDRDQLERVVVNLLSNALKFSDPDKGGQVVICGRRTGNGVSLAVQDHGIGIAPEDQHLLFTRFFRSGAAKARGIPGTGLGLAVVKGIVDNHGGELTVDSSPGLGTTMTVTLPPALPGPRHA